MGVNGVQRMKRAVANFVRTLFFYFFRVFPVNSRKIFVQNFNGKGYGGDPKYIVEELLQRGVDVVIVWAVCNSAERNFPEGVRIVRHKSIRAFYEEATAGIWIDNCRKQPFVRKRKNQFYVQTWHGEPGLFKKVEKDAMQSLTPYYIKQAKHDSAMINLFLSWAKVQSNLIRSSFWYDGEIIECGSPKDDLLLTENIRIREKVYTHFELSHDTKIILYAPTFRDNFNLSVYLLDYQLVLNTLHEQTKQNWVFLVRLHPNISEKSDMFIYSNVVKNASDYDDMQELIYTCDILISDYSSCVYAFALMKKPVFLYVKDYDNYKTERDFYVDLFSLPFPAAMNMNGLITNITSFDQTVYTQRLNSFFREEGLFDAGRASERVVDRIVSEITKPV